MSETSTPVVEIAPRAVESAPSSTEPAQAAPWTKEVASGSGNEKQETPAVPVPETAVAAKSDTPAGVRKLSGNTADGGDWDATVTELSEHLTS